MPKPIAATRTPGFTLIEMMAVVAVIAILATIALPSLQDRIVRAQIVEAVPLADIAKPAIAAMWQATKTLPPDNAAIGLPAPDKIVGNLVRSMSVDNGAIHIVFGNKANGTLQGKTLTLRPAVVEDAPVVPVAWLCGHAKAPDKMVAKGVDQTDVAERYLPLNCR
jgi:type IV pilus assembly protein PilA